MCLIDFSHVGSNKFDKTTILDDVRTIPDQRFVYVGFSGDNPLLKEIRQTLRSNILREDFTPTKLADKILPLVEQSIRKEVYYYGIVFVGIGEGGKLEVVYVETTAWPDENRPKEQEKFKVKLTKKEVNHYYVTGSGAKWVNEFIKAQYGDATGQVNIPMNMPNDDAEKLVIEALTYSSHRTVGVGGVLQGFIFVWML